MASNRWSSRGSAIFGLVCLAVLVGGFGWWAAVTRISGAVVAPGLIEVEQNRQVVQHPDGGVVAAIEVKEGDSVAAGDLLVRLDETLLRSELAVVEGQLYEVMARRDRLEAERDGADTIVFDPDLVAAAAAQPAHAALVEGQARLFEARQASLLRERAQLDQQGQQIASQIQGIDAQIAATDTQLSLIAEELDSQQKLLDKGLAQAARVLALRREAANLEGRRGELVAGKAQAGERITEIAIMADRLLTDRQEQAISTLRDLGFNEIELAEKRRALAERIGRLDIRAPVAGVVYGMQVFAPRSVIRPADPLLYLIPQDRPLVIAARVAPINIDQVRVGQEVALRFSAFDSRHTPELAGVVEQVSADAFPDDRTGPYYRAQLRLVDGELARLPEGTVLVPGMPVEAFIRTGDRTPFEYLVQPLASYFTRAFRES